MTIGTTASLRPSLGTWSTRSSRPYATPRRRWHRYCCVALRFGRTAIGLPLRALEVLASPGSAPAEETRALQPPLLPPATLPRLAPASVLALRLRDGISGSEQTAAAACAGEAAGLRLRGVAAPATPLATDLLSRLYPVARDASGVVLWSCLGRQAMRPSSSVLNGLQAWFECSFSGALPSLRPSLPKKKADAWEAALWYSADSQQ